MRVLIAVLALTFAGCASQPRLKPFATDGCTLFPDGTSKKKDLWLHCCVAHDHKYWLGGTTADRINADRQLRACVAAVGRPRTGELMFLGVRVGGMPYFPTGWRWGYGWRYFRGYKPLSDAEKKLVDESPKR